MISSDQYSAIGGCCPSASSASAGTAQFTGIEGYDALRLIGYSSNAIAVLIFGDVLGDTGEGIFRFDANSTAAELLPNTVKPAVIAEFSPGRWVRLL